VSVLFFSLSFVLLEERGWSWFPLENQNPKKSKRILQQCTVCVCVLPSSFWFGAAGFLLYRPHTVERVDVKS
jgi:hypothetical protein